MQGLFPWNRSIGWWAAGTTLLVAAFLGCAPLIVDPAPYCERFLEAVLPSDSFRGLFPLFAAYSLLFHAPLEEVFWRGVVTHPGRAGLGWTPAGNAFFFGLLHAVPLGVLLGPPGLLFSLPTGAAGTIWALVTLRTGSRFPALLSHAAADAILLL